VANGDIVDAPGARAALGASGADGVMVGRGIQGRPWQIARIAAALRGERAPEEPKGAALADLAAEHYDAALSFYGTELGARVVRKHLGWYMDRAGTPPALRREVLTAAVGMVRRMLPAALDSHAEAA
jgi:tRNA-dihydrouridine synthase B